MENLARYIICASLSQERMTYIPDESKVVYKSKDTKEEKIFDALAWLAAMCSHVPNKGESHRAGLLWILQQRGAGQAQKERAGRADTFNPGTRWLIRGIQTKLGLGIVVGSSNDG